MLFWVFLLGFFFYKCLKSNDFGVVGNLFYFFIRLNGYDDDYNDSDEQPSSDMILGLGIFV